MSAQTVLIADDDAQIRELLELYLVKEGFAVEQAADGAEAILKAQQLKPDLIILDIMMPVLDGMEVCRQVRKFSRVPVIMLTARVEDEDRIMGLELGADDYVTKPYSPREVVARVKAVLRRGARTQEMPAVLTLGKLSLDTNAHSAKLGGASVELTPTEFGMLQLLVSQPGRVFTRLQLLEAAQGMSYEGYERSVDVHVKNIRRKLKDADPDQQYIETVFGVGYRARKMEL